eukprot:14953-Heterococcus_DN1.PRE.1
MYVSRQAVNCSGSALLTLQDAQPNVATDNSSSSSSSATSSVVAAVVNTSSDTDSTTDAVTALRWGLGGSVQFEDIWSSILVLTRAAITRDLSYITGCNCQF